jgi:hypothetical protein
VITVVHPAARGLNAYGHMAITVEGPAVPVAEAVARLPEHRTIGCAHERQSGESHPSLMTDSVGEGDEVAVLKRGDTHLRLEQAIRPFADRSGLRDDDEVFHADVDLTQTQDSHARRLFLADRRPDLYTNFVGR